MSRQPLKKTVDRIILNQIFMILQERRYEDEIVAVNELEKILRVKKKTLYQWAELRQIPSIKLQGCLRFDLDDVLEWVKSCKKEPHDISC